MCLKVFFFFLRQHLFFLIFEMTLRGLKLHQFLPVGLRGRQEQKNLVKIENRNRNWSIAAVKYFLIEVCEKGSFCKNLWKRGEGNNAVSDAGRGGEEKGAYHSSHFIRPWNAGVIWSGRHRNKTPNYKLNSRHWLADQRSHAWWGLVLGLQR